MLQVLEALFLTVGSTDYFAKDLIGRRVTPTGSTDRQNTQVFK
jgi:hypothetical protein